ncbi:MAG TPA: lactonase family protein [Ktedonobacteraceae bacterium]
MASQQYMLYLGSYAKAEQAGIYAFHFASPSGQLTPRWSFAGIVNPSFIALHANKRWLFAVSEMSLHSDGRSGEVWALDLAEQGTESQPHEINHQPSNGDWPCHLTIDASGRWILVSNYQSGNISVFPILTNGALGTLAENVQHSGHGPNPERQEGPHTHSTIFTPDQRFVVVADLGSDQLVIYTFDTTNGKLSEHGRVHCPPASGPRHMAFHPTGQQFYVSFELNNTVTVYNYDAIQGTFNARQTLSTLPPDAHENTAADIHLTPNGSLLYVSNRGNESLAIYTITTGGLLELLAIVPCGGLCPRNFAFDPTGHFVLVANQHSDELTVWPLLNSSSEPGQPPAQIAIPGASCVRFG